MWILALLVLVVVIALVWLVVLRWLKDDGFPVRASLEEAGSVPEWSPGTEREREGHAATHQGLCQAKDRNAARTWDPGL
jgi:hypothetical protein